MIDIIKLFIKCFSFVSFLTITVILLMLVISLTGCSSKRVQYVPKVQYVKIPVKCEVSKLPTKPVMKKSVYHTLNDVLIYAEQLKLIVDSCATELSSIKK